MNDNEEIETLDEIEVEDVPEVSEVPETVPEEKKTEEEPTPVEPLSEEKTPEEKPVEEPKVEEPKQVEETIKPTEEPKQEESKQEEPPKKEEKKKKKNILPIILIIILLLAIGGIVFFLINKNHKKESPTNSNEIIISFNTNGGDQIKELTIKKEEEITLPTPTKKGFTFLGWYQGGQKIEGKIKFSENAVLLAKWEKENAKKEFTITFSPSMNPPSITLQCGLPVFLEEYEGPERQYEWFRGWINKATGQKYTSGQILGCEDTTFEAYWVPKNVTIDYQYIIGGKIKNSYDIEPNLKLNITPYLSCSDNMTLTLPEKMPEIEGYYFDKWIYYSGIKIRQEAKNGDKITCNTPHIGLQAIYILDKKDSNEGKEFTVKFDLNGGKGHINDQKVIYKEKAAKPAKPTRDGYDFIGWSPDIDSVLIIKDTTFTAMWKEKAPDPEPEPEPDKPTEPVNDDENN